MGTAHHNALGAFAMVGDAHPTNHPLQGVICMKIGTVAARAIAVAFITCWAAAAGAQAPAVIWVSQPVEPGETVMVYGGPWTDVKGIELSGPERRTVRPLKATDDCLSFVYPADWPLAAFTARVTSGAAGSVEFRVNAPDVWWLQGDAGRSASPGGWLRAFGRSIGYHKGASLELRGAGRVIKLPAADCDRFSLRVELPKDPIAGRYEVFLKNGLDEQPVSAGRIEIAPYKEPWPEKIFNVVDYGAVANDANDDSRAVRAALADIAANGGGVLYFPRGRYGMRGTLELPPNTLLRGEDMTLSQIYWLDEDAPKGPLVSGKHHFGIENIFLVAGNVDEGFVVTPPEKDDHWKKEGVLLRRVRARFLHTDNFIAEESFRRSQAGGMPLRITADLVRVVDCDFYFSKGDSAVSGDYLLASGNRFEGPGCGYLGGRCCIFENNNSEGRGMSFANGTRCFYLKGNRIGGVYGDGDRETFTFDGGDPAYADTVVSAADRTVQLKPGGWRHGPEIWVDRPIFIVGGKGAGQMRFITRVDGRDVQIDRPWDLQPDTDSYFAIAQVRSKLLFVDNHDRDGNPFAMYGSAVDAVVAGNTLARTGGLHAHGMFKGAPEPSWFIQFLGNQIVEGNSVRGPFSFVVPATDSWLGFFDRGIRKPLTYPENRVGIMRRNVLESNAFLDSFGRVKNLLVENNLVRNADKGVVIGPDVQDAILRGNRFENVIRPYNVNDRTLVPPADRLLAGLSAAAVLKPGLPDDWGQFVSAAEALAKQDLPEAEAAPAAAGILNRAARALSAKVGNRPIASATVAALFGLDLSQSSPWLFGRIVPNKDTKIPIGIAYPAWSLPATLTASTAGIDGWQVRVDSPVKLVPGKNGACGVWITRPACAIHAAGGIRDRRRRLEVQIPRALFLGQPGRDRTAGGRALQERQRQAVGPRGASAGDPPGCDRSVRHARWPAPLGAGEGRCRRGGGSVQSVPEHRDGHRACRGGAPRRPGAASKNSWGRTQLAGVRQRPADRLQRSARRPALRRSQSGRQPAAPHQQPWHGALAGRIQALGGRSGQAGRFAGGAGGGTGQDAGGFAGGQNR